MENQNAALQFVVALASERHQSEIETATQKIKHAPRNLFVVQNETWNALKASDVAAVTSGTATLETAILNTPMAIVYQTSPFNYKLLRPLITVEHFGLINLIAEERLAKELIQDEFTPETLSAELFHLLEPETNRKMRERLTEVTDKLGKGGASKRAAQAVIKLIKS